MKEGLASTKCGSWYPFARAKVSTRSPPTASEIVGFVAAAAKELAPQGGRPVVARAQRLPAQGEVDRLELRPAPRLVRRRGVGPRPVGEAEVEVRRLGKVLEETVVTVVREVA